MSLFRSPIKSNRRESKPSYKILQDKLEKSLENLNLCMSCSLDTDPEPTETYLKDAKSNLRESWRIFDQASNEVHALLSKKGVSEECCALKQRYNETKKRVKDFNTSIKWKLLGQGIEEYSDIDNLSDITSASRMTSSLRRATMQEKLNVARVKNENKKRELELENQKKITSYTRKEEIFRA